MRLALRLAIACLALPSVLPALSQGRVRSSDTSDPDLPSLLAPPSSPHRIGSFFRGADAGLTLTQAHDSSNGWYSMATPGISLSISPHLSFDAATPIYLWRLSYDKPLYGAGADTAPPSTSAYGQPGAADLSPQPGRYTTQLSPHTWNAGDTFVSAHLNFAPGRLAYTLTPSLIIPTGDKATGLSTGHFTFDFDQHFELPLARFTPLLDAGIGDSSSAANQLVTRDASSLGPLAHFQLGLAAPLALPMLRSRRFMLSSFAYEQLPLGDNRVYSTQLDASGSERTIAVGHRATEDNGFTNSLQIPVSSHFAVAGYYNRSLRLHLDTAAISLQFNLRGHRSGRQTADDGSASLLRDVVR